MQVYVYRTVPPYTLSRKKKSAITSPILVRGQLPLTSSFLLRVCLAAASDFDGLCFTCCTSLCWLVACTRTIVCRDQRWSHTLVCKDQRWSRRNALQHQETLQTLTPLCASLENRSNVRHRYTPHQRNCNIER